MGTCRQNDVILTSMRRRHVASTSVRCHFYVMCLLETDTVQYIGLVHHYNKHQTQHEIHTTHKTPILPAWNLIHKRRFIEKSQNGIRQNNETSTCLVRHNIERQKIENAVHCKKIRRFYGKIPGIWLPVLLPLLLRAFYL